MRIISLLAALVLLLALPPDVGADSGADEAELRFARGNALYRAGKLEEALGEFFASNRLAPNRNVVFNIARSYEGLGRYDEAYRYYAEYLAAETDPDAVVDAQRRLEALAPRVALLRVESDPPGATVYLGRKDLGGRGETPLILALKPGRHTVLLERRGHHPVEQEVELVRGREAHLNVPLELVVGTLRVTSTPSARVWVNRAVGDPRPPDAAATPATLRVPPGRHTLELEADGFRPRRLDVIVKEAAETTLEVVLDERPPDSGTVVLVSRDPGALVVVDGVEKGFTPAVLSLPVGQHAVVVRSPGFQPWRRTVSVEKDGRLFLEVELAESEQEVTGATRVTQAVGDAPASVSIILRDEIWAFGYQTLTDAVRATRGYYTSYDHNYEAIGVRGFSRPGDYTNRILVTRDGHAMNDNWIGATAVGRDLAPDLSDIARIEVIRGPGSTFYGQGAFFGVVNLVSEAPDQGPTVRAGGRLDSAGGGTASARGRQGLGPVDVSVSASAYQSDGQALYFEEFADTPSGGKVEGADGEAAQRAAIRAQAYGFQLDGGFSRRSKDLPTAPFETVFDPGAHETTGREQTRTYDERGYVEGRYDLERGPLRVSARMAYDRQRYRGVYPYDDGDEAFVLRDAGQGDWITGELRAVLGFLGQRLTLGAEAARHQVRQHVDYESDGEHDLADRHQFVNASLYAVTENALGERVRVTAGARFDLFGEQQATALSPRVAVVTRPYERGRTKLVLGRAFRAPSVYELYYHDDGITQIPAEVLAPETIWTGEVEHTHELGRRSFVSASIFASRITDLIVLSTNDDDLLVFANSPEGIRSMGMELEGRITRLDGAWVGAAASIASLESDDREARGNSAAIVSSLRGFWPAAGDRLGMAGELILNSRRLRRDGARTPTAVIGNLFASGRIGEQGLRYRVGVTNLFDQDWLVPVGEEFVQQAIAQPGRTFVAQLVYEHP